MAEYLSFVFGFVAGISLWFYHDMKYNPYTRGYGDGYEEAMKEMAEKRNKEQEGWW